MIDQIPIIRGIFELADQGGPFVVWIFLSGVLMWGLVFERIWYFNFVLPRQLADTRAKWEAREDHSSWCARQIREAMISRVNVSMSSGIGVMAVLVPLSPLLGLIGTVSGMLQVFTSIALLGNADARAMAAGVGAAMICTITGLAVSISGLYPVYHFRRRVARETEVLGDELSL
ncbi:MAG: MotA/TolQ/ExbB proton channel family protein [Gammaproteobacteria bacterium]|nr:MotA/TolQ/ExbB proton channel family protein [Gammaproteobacteria bacterium]